MSEKTGNSAKQPNLSPIPEFEDPADSPAWDSEEEQLSFLNSSPNRYPTDHSDLLSGSDFAESHPARWHSHPLSSTDYNFIDLPTESVPSGGLTQEVFSPGRLSHNNMPANQPEIIDLVKSFNRTLRNWSQNFNRLKSGSSLQQGDVDDMKLKRSDIENQADDIFDIVDEESDNYNSVLQKVNKVRSEMSSLYEIYENARQGAANPLQTAAIVPAQQSQDDADIILDREITKLMSVLLHFHNELDRLIGKLPVVSASGPTNENLEVYKELLEAAKSSSKSAENTYLKIVAEVSVYN